MNLTDFLAKLAKVKDKFEWRLEPNGCIRGWREAYKCRWCYCPITAVCLEETNVDLGMSYTIEAAHKIDLNYANRGRIMWAADSIQGDEEIRIQLLNALGLQA